MPHGLTFGCCESGDIPNDRFGDVCRNVLGGPFFSITTDLTDEDDYLGVWIPLESLQSIDVGGAHHRVPADTNTGCEANV